MKNIKDYLIFFRDYFQISKYYYIYIINLFLIFILTLLIYFSIISYRRLIIFFLILFYIYFYKFFMFLIIESNWKLFLLKNEKILNYLWLIHKWSNLFLRLVLYLEEKYIYNILKKNCNILIKLCLFLLFLLVLNPIKIVFTKFYRILYKWKNYTYMNITILRMIGLILGVLFISQIINLILFYSKINIFILVYILIILLNLLNEWFEPSINPQSLKFWHLEKLSLQQILYRRVDISIIAQLLEKNRFSILNKYNNEINFEIIRKFMIGFTWFMINNFYNLQNKFSYNTVSLLDDLYHDFLIEVPNNIFIIYYYEELIGTKLISINNKQYISLPQLYQDELNLENVNWVKIKTIIEFNNKIFKILLYLVWDLEYLLDHIIQDNEINWIYKNIQFSGTNTIIVFSHYLLIGEEVNYYKFIKDKKFLNYNMLCILKNIQQYNFSINSQINPIYLENIILRDKDFLCEYSKLMNFSTFYDEILKSYQNYLGICPLEVYINYINENYNEYKLILPNKKKDYYNQQLIIIERDYQILKNLILTNEKNTNKK